MIKDFQKILLNHWLFFLILILASVLRFWRLESLTTFGGDQGFDFLTIKNTILNGKLTLLGPKIGPYNNLGQLYLGPAYYYILAPALFFAKFDPIGPAILTTIFSVSTILIIYIICIKFFSKYIAFIASLLFATNPLFISQSRAASNPHIIPFFEATFLMSLLNMAEGRTKFFWHILAGFSLGIMFQLHYLAISQAVLFIPVFLKRRNWQILLIPLVAFLITISGQILFEIRHDFFISKQFLIQIQHGSNVENFFEILSNLRRAFLELLGVISPSPLIVVFIFLISLFAVFYSHQKNKKPIFPLAIITLSMLLNLIFIATYSGEISLNYYTTSFPGVSIMAAFLIVAFYKAFNNWFFKILPLFLLIQILLTYLTSYNLNSGSGYTMPSGWNAKGVKKVARIVSVDVESGQKYNIAATLDGDTRAMPYRYLLEVYSKKPMKVEDYPQAEIIYLVSRDSENALNSYTVWEVSSLSPFEIIRKWDIQNGVYLYKLKKINES